MPKKIETVFGKVAPANLVPAAAVIQGGRALFGQTGRKASLGRILRVSSKSLRGNFKMFTKTIFLEFLRG